VSDKFLSFAMICVIPLVCFKHLRYDFIFLLPAFAYALKNFSEPAAKVVLLAIAFDWYILKLFDPPAGWLMFAHSKPILLLVNLVLCSAMLACLLMMSRTRQMPIKTQGAVP
jgi:hypothetical protein